MIKYYDRLFGIESNIDKFTFEQIGKNKNTTREIPVIKSDTYYINENEISNVEADDNIYKTYTLTENETLLYKGEMTFNNASYFSKDCTFYINHLLRDIKGNSSSLRYILSLNTSILFNITTELINSLDGNYIINKEITNQYNIDMSSKIGDKLILEIYGKSKIYGNSLSFLFNNKDSFITKTNPKIKASDIITQIDGKYYNQDEANSMFILGSKVVSVETYNDLPQPAENYQDRLYYVKNPISTSIFFNKYPSGLYIVRETSIGVFEWKQSGIQVQTSSETNCVLNYISSEWTAVINSEPIFYVGSMWRFENQWYQNITGTATTTTPNIDTTNWALIITGTPEFDEYFIYPSDNILGDNVFTVLNDITKINNVYINGVANSEISDVTYDGKNVTVNRPLVNGDSVRITYNRHGTVNPDTYTQGEIDTKDAQSVLESKDYTNQKTIDTENYIDQKVIEIENYVDQNSASKVNDNIFTGDNSFEKGISVDAPFILNDKNPTTASLSPNIWNSSTVQLSAGWTADAETGKYNKTSGNTNPLIILFTEPLNNGDKYFFSASQSGATSETNGLKVYTTNDGTNINEYIVDWKWMEKVGEAYTNGTEKVLGLIIVPTSAFSGYIIISQLEKYLTYNSSIQTINSPTSTDYPKWELAVKDNSLYLGSDGYKTRVYSGNNLCIGYNSYTSSYSGGGNTIYGNNSMTRAASGTGNVILGNYVGNSSVELYNVHIGYNNSMYHKNYYVVSEYNVIIGNSATAGINNYTNTVSKCVYIGASSRYTSQASPADITNEISIGYQSSAYGSNTIHIGNSNNTSISFGAGTGTAFTNRSDERIKEDIKDADTSMCYDDIKSIPLKRFKYKDFVGNKGDQHITGFIAQEFREFFPKAVFESDIDYPELDSDGNRIKEKIKKTVIDPEEKDETKREKEIEVEIEKTFTIEKVLSIDTSQILPTLVGAVKQLIKDNEVLKEKIKVLESK